MGWGRGNTEICLCQDMDTGANQYQRRWQQRRSQFTNRLCHCSPPKRRVTIRTDLEILDDLVDGGDAHARQRQKVRHVHLGRVYVESGQEREADDAGRHLGLVLLRLHDRLQLHVRVQRADERAQLLRVHLLNATLVLPCNAQQKKLNQPSNQPRISKCVHLWPKTH